MSALPASIPAVRSVVDPAIVHMEYVGPKEFHSQDPALLQQLAKQAKRIISLRKLLSEAEGELQMEAVNHGHTRRLIDSTEQQGRIRLENATNNLKIAQQELKEKNEELQKSRRQLAEIERKHQPLMERERDAAMQLQNMGDEYRKIEGQLEQWMERNVELQRAVDETAENNSDMMLKLRELQISYEELCSLQMQPTREIVRKVSLAPSQTSTHVSSPKNLPPTIPVQKQSSSSVNTASDTGFANNNNDGTGYGNFNNNNYNNNNNNNDLPPTQPLPPSYADEDLYFGGAEGARGGGGGGGGVPIAEHPAASSGLADTNIDFSHGEVTGYEV